MVDKKILTIGFLIVTLLASVIYIQMNAVKIRVDSDAATFYAKDLNVYGVPFGFFKVAGREFTSVFDGTSKMNRRSSGIVVSSFIDNVSNTVLIKRVTPYIRGPVVKESWFFNGSVSDVGVFPIYHKVEVFNASGFFFRYEVRDLTYDGLTEKLFGTNMSFGKNMKVTWQDGFRWAWVYKAGILKVQYGIPSDYEVFNVRLFDPVKEKPDIKDDNSVFIVDNCFNVTKYKTAVVPVFENFSKCWNTTIFFDCKNVTHINETTSLPYVVVNATCKNKTETSCYNYTEKVGTKEILVPYVVKECNPYVVVGEKQLNYSKQDFNCSNDVKDCVVCDSCLDGNCDGICDIRGGETCYKNCNGTEIYKNSVVIWKSTSIPVEKMSYEV